ncbi:bacterial lipid A biosynthesis acyltransferase family protein [Janthinobacterium agaricidamnosum NBRC 102515 = DSM 9628]|uniref:Bacterial lipid A biosynthesis acyltransferase family protein n=2 Tax=Janthinobacterium agaricidamnosum TaxID=55508 RepID=W0VD96_9BURK|nr:bacterial lipid A biosynthesis acyltransferase family protein [Janthinobacterium agaricidamnosum NBRC 102515 = DSM 9628]
MLVHIFRFLSMFPLWILHSLGAVLGWLVYLLSPSYRRRMRDNMARAGFSQHLSAAIAESGKSVLELPFIWCAAPGRVARHATVDNWELVQQALERGKGIVFLTPHLGCFEIVAQQIALRTALTVMYRPPRQAALKPLIEGARARENLALAPANMSGVRIFAKCLKKGQPIGLLPDQVPQEGEGVWADFFGRSAYTMTLPAKLALMGDAQVIVTYAERLPGGKGYKVHFVPFEASLEGDSASQARTINAAMEQLIARCPSQYFWSYNRYKVPRGAPPPDAAANAPASAREHA